MREAIRDRGRLEHMMMAIDNVIEFTQNVTLEKFASDKMLFYAVVYNVQIIGEAAYKLTQEFRKAHPQLEWEDIIGLRHVLVHGYYTVKTQGIWNIVQNDIPPLREQLLAYIAEFPEDGE